MTYVPWTLSSIGSPERAVAELWSGYIELARVASRFLHNRYVRSCGQLLPAISPCLQQRTAVSRSLFRGKEMAMATENKEAEGRVCMYQGRSPGAQLLLLYYSHGLYYNTPARGELIIGSIAPSPPCLFAHSSQNTL